MINTRTPKKMLRARRNRELRVRKSSRKLMTLTLSRSIRKPVEFSTLFAQPL